jgi:hypothetical protein
MVPAKQVLGISLSLSGGGGASEGSQAGQGENLAKGSGQLIINPVCLRLTLVFILNWMTSHEGSS